MWSDGLIHIVGTVKGICQDPSPNPAEISQMVHMKYVGPSIYFDSAQENQSNLNNVTNGIKLRCWEVKVNSPHTQQKLSEWFKHFRGIFTALMNINKLKFIDYNSHLTSGMMLIKHKHVYEMKLHIHIAVTKNLRVAKK